MIDSHFHINYFPENELAELAKAARARGVLAGVVAGVWLEDTVQNVSWQKRFSPCPLRYFSRAQLTQEMALLRASEESLGLFLCHGLHPVQVHQRWLLPGGEVDEDTLAEELIEFERLHDAHADLLWAIGETGFDLSREVLEHEHCLGVDKKAILALQERAFEACVKLALRTGKPLIIHTRGAWAHTLGRLREALDRGVCRAMIHCYGGPAEDVKRLASWGVFASFGGVATWPQARRVHAAASQYDGRYFLLETDAPDLPPVHEDGTKPPRNSPHELAGICATIARLRNEDTAALADRSDANLLRYLGLAPID